MKNYKTFETDRLLLKPTTEQDAHFILALLNTPKWHQFIGDRNVKTEEDARQYIHTKMLPQLKKLGFGNYTVIKKEDGSKMGTCGIYDREGLEGVDLGFAFLPEFEKQGYAFEAAQKLKEVAFSVFGLTKMKAITVHENDSSRRLLEKLGFTLAGITKIPNDEEELLLYTIDLSTEIKNNSK